MADTGLAKKVGGTFRGHKVVDLQEVAVHRTPLTFGALGDPRLPEILDHHQIRFALINLRPRHITTVPSD